VYRSSVLSRMLEECLRMLQNSVACFQEGYTSYDSLFLCHCGVLLTEAKLMTYKSIIFNQWEEPF
jgi:hypothetical protein